MLKRLRPSHLNFISGVAGGILLAIGFLWLLWLLLFQHSSLSVTSLLTFPGIAPVTAPEAQLPPLVAAGITLHHADQSAALSQPRALLLASQSEPLAAANAQTTTARYVLLDYPSSSGATPHADFKDTPVWLIWYQKIPQTAANAAVDPNSTSQSTRDLYVFLDATTGSELLSVWV